MRPLAHALGALTLLALLSNACAATPSDDAKVSSRIALVVGNGDYKSSPLPNPVNDARAISEALRKLGFEVLQFENLNQRHFLAALREFGNKLRQSGDVGLFYYAGHGMQVKGSNYLIPVDSDIAGEDEVKYLAIDAGQVLDKMEQAGNRLNIVILDACRDNPFARSNRSKKFGLAQMDAPSGMLIAFATSPGAVAFDGEGTNGVYTKHLLRNVALAGVPIELMFKRVREGVAKETGQKQVPWESSSLFGDFFFNPTPDTTATVIDSKVIELAFWDSVSRSNSSAELRAYLDKYPYGQFAQLARAKLDAYATSNTAAGAEKSVDTSSKVALAQPGASRPALSPTQWKPGDSWTYVLLEGGKKKVDLVSVTIVAVESDSITETVTRDGVPTYREERRFPQGFDAVSAFQDLVLPGNFSLLEFAPYVVSSSLPKAGDEWINRESMVSLKETPDRIPLTFHVQVTGSEKLRVPAGSFSAVRVDARGMRAGTSTPALLLSYWYSPEVRRVVKVAWRQPSAGNRSTVENTFELYGFQQSR